LCNWVRWRVVYPSYGQHSPVLQASASDRDTMCFRLPEEAKRPTCAIIVSADSMRAGCAPASSPWRRKVAAGLGRPTHEALCPNPATCWRWAQMPRPVGRSQAATGLSREESGRGERMEGCFRRSRPTGGALDSCARSTFDGLACLHVGFLQPRQP
jgi:hypothetical protein